MALVGRRKETKLNMAKKKNIVPINSMRDLVDLVNHNSQVLDRRTKKLVKSARNMKILYFIAVGYAIYTAIECRKQEEQVYQLSIKVKKLEHNEGE